MTGFPFALLFGAPPPPNRHQILSVTNDGSDNALFTTRIAHGLSASATIVVGAVSVSNYNKPATVATTPTNRTFTTGQGFVSNATGGRWD